MARQHPRSRLRSPALAVFLAAGLAGCGGAPAGAAGIVFPAPVNLCGQLFSGEQRTMDFAFEVREVPVRIDGIGSACGCAERRLQVEGRDWPFGKEIPPGSRGRIRVLFDTAGFLGEKNVSLEVRGEGPGLPATLEIRSFLKPWFEADPPALDLGSVDLAEERRIPLRVRGPEPFRLLPPDQPLPYGLRVEGVPSPEPAREQEITVVLPAADPEQPLPEGRQLAVLRLPSDRRWRFAWSLRFDYAGTLYVQPFALLLGRLTAGRERRERIEAGVRRGRLHLEGWRLEGFQGLEVQPLVVEEGRRYAFDVLFPADLPEGPLYSRLLLDLVHEDEGVERRLEREVKITALVRGGAGESSGESG